MTMTTTTSPSATPTKPLTIGVFGGSFNPIHLGHALLAITTQQTKAYVDEVVLVPVYKHAVKRDLLPFDDRVAMCRRAVAHFGTTMSVSTIERDVGESNGAMLRALRATYPPGTQLVWICGDDFFRWMHRPKGLETLAEVSGLIVQRRLHRQTSSGRNDNNSNDHRQSDSRHFYQEPIDEDRVREIARRMNNLRIDYIYGELPHFSSTLVRRAPGHWKSFLTQTVATYLDERPHLLEQLLVNLQADCAAEDKKQTTTQAVTPSQAASRVVAPPSLHQRSPSTLETHGRAAAVLMLGLQAIHLLQYERGYTGLRLSLGAAVHGPPLATAQAHTDALVQEILQAATTDAAVLAPEVQALAAELERIPVWLALDRAVVETRGEAWSHVPGPEGWWGRLALVEKFNARIDVLIGGAVRALQEILSHSSSSSTTTTNNNTTTTNNNNAHTNTRAIPELLSKWCEGKEALGRQRAFVCAGGRDVPTLVRTSLPLRERCHQTIAAKERSLARVLSLEAGLSSTQTAVVAAPEALFKLLEKVTLLEYTLMGSFAATTPLPLVHKLLAQVKPDEPFDVVQFFEASTAAIDFLLSFAKALAASACASA
jgi:nicotinate (nicotinamide) nucleotide adenylyltransferase